MKIKDLRIYPVKSFAGSSLEEAELEARGFKNDRRWMLVDEHGRFISQREYPFLTLWRVKVDGNSLEFEHKKTGEVFVIDNVKATDGDLVDVEVWGTHFQARLVEMKNDLLFQNLGVSARLVYMSDDTRRGIDPSYAKEDEEVSFADAYPYLITNTASLEVLSERLGEKLEMLRFRPNIVVESNTPFVEDDWKIIRINQQQFRIPKPCSRCVMITIDPQTTQKKPKVMETLAEFRKEGNKVLFGANAIWESHSNETAFVRVGDELTYLYE